MAFVDILRLGILFVISLVCLAILFFRKLETEGKEVA